MARIIAVAVPKGGAGKTSTTLNLGAALAARGQRVLLIDFDPQGNLSLSLRATPVSPSLYSTIREFITTWEPHIERVIVPSSIPNVDVVPTDVWLNESDEELRSADRREYVLRKLLEPVSPAYDFVLIDTLPYFGMLVKNALVAADELIIPMQAEFLATQSIEMMLKLVERIQRSGLNPLLRVLGVLVTQVDLRTNRVFGCEALIRWKQPDLGMISPAKYIPLAEETGLIVPIGEWVLRTACLQCKAWQDAGLPPVTVAVNISARQFREKNLFELVGTTLAETGLAPGQLELEVTESVIMHDAQQVIASLQAFRDMGVRLSVDDFGTGYSSLSYLKRFPVDRLKIDQSFVRDLSSNADDVAIAQAIITLGHTLNLHVIAEGVETPEQLAFLRNHHCDEMQGYLFGKPMLAEDFAKLLASGRTLEH